MKPTEKVEEEEEDGHGRAEGQQGDKRATILSLYLLHGLGRGHGKKWNVIDWNYLKKKKKIHQFP